MTKPSQSDHAHHAQDLKKAADDKVQPHPGADKDSLTPNKGMKSIPQEDQAPSGAFGAEGERPVIGRSRVSR